VSVTRIIIKTALMPLEEDMKILLIPLSQQTSPASTPERDGDNWFRGGPPMARFNKAGADARPLRNALLVALLGWLPLAILTALQSLVTQDDSFPSFITDYAVLARSLIAAPLLVLAEDVAARHLSVLGRHFRDTGLVRAKDQPRFQEIVRSTRSLRDSFVTEMGMIAVALALAVGWATVPLHLMPAWHGLGNGSFSVAGIWHQFVSLPILLFLMLGWFWRLILWGRFLFEVSRLELRMIPSHPDGSAGLKFVGISLQSLALGPCALGAILAGTIANRILHQGDTLLSFRMMILGFIVVMLALTAGPLLSFTPKLLEAMHRGALEYGAMARAVGRQWERRWLSGEVRDEVLRTDDFVTTNSLYSIVSHVYTMNVVPVEWRNLVTVVLASILPFIPVALIEVSPMELFHKLSGFFL
jgi:hypothetical protein